jgi:hypothetical protein
MPRLKGNVSIRTTAKAGELLDEYLREHPDMTETEVTAEALINFCHQKQAGEVAEKAEA